MVKIGESSSEGTLGEPKSTSALDAQRDGRSDLPQSPSSDETVADILTEMDELVGLDEAKKQIRRIVATHEANRIRHEHGHARVPIALHLVFQGPPGTGKTTLARIVARLYRAVGLLPRGHLVEVDRSGLVAGYVGQTAIKVQEVVAQADGGILFVDEAYSLASDNGAGFGDEAIATLVKEMENRRDRMAVVIAGYAKAIDDLLVSNEGLRSRFKQYVTFNDYSHDELSAIFARLADEHSIALDKDVSDAVSTHLEQAQTAGAAGNARYVRNLFEEMFARMSERAIEDGVVEAHEVVAFVVNDVPEIVSREQHFGFVNPMDSSP